MITASKLIPTAALLLAAALQTASAQEPVTNTYEALVLNLNLNAVSQGPTRTSSAGSTTGVNVSSVSSRDVIQVLGAATGNTFSRQARLVVLVPTNDLDTTWIVQIQDGTKSVDVTGFIGHQEGPYSVGSAFVQSRTGSAGGTEYSVDGFTLQDQAGFPALTEHFNVAGFTATTSSGIVGRRGVVRQIDAINADVSGTGDSSGQILIIEGSVNANGIGTQQIVTNPVIINS
jgi:hypothetical protein